MQLLAKKLKQHMKNVDPKKHISTINQIAQYIYDNVEEAISLDSLATQFSVSKYHLNRLFFAQTGMNLGEFMQRRRMELAYELIRSKENYRDTHDNLTILRAGLGFR